MYIASEDASIAPFNVKCLHCRLHNNNAGVFKNHNTSRHISYLMLPAPAGHSELAGNGSQNEVHERQIFSVKP